MVIVCIDTYDGMNQKPMNTKNYNGWKNRQTWNVALWIGNDKDLYGTVRDFMRIYKGKSPYKDFMRGCGTPGDKTPDGIAWLSNKLSYRELNSFMRELAQ